MTALHRKLFRDLWEIKGQVFAISAVIAAGVAMFVMYQSTFQSLRLTQEAYYDRYRFADVFASLKRAPKRLEGRLAEIPGVARAQTRVVVNVTIDLPSNTEPLVGQLISVPGERTSILNDIAIRTGRYIEPDKPDEVVVSEGFALANDLLPGDTVAAVINGRRRELEIVGTALSPEFVYVIRPGELIPDEARFGVFWMGEKALASAFDMEGGFNDVNLTLMPGTSEREVITRLDRLLEPYGGLGAIPRSLQISHWSLEQELTGLQSAGFIMPVIFLSVAAFLLNVVLNRIVAVQRTQIAALKALGYSRGEIAVHYVQWSLTIAVTGGILGTVGGAWMGSGMIRLYNDFFRFPLPRVPAAAAGAVLGAGGLSGLRGAGRLELGDAGFAAGAGRGHATRAAGELPRKPGRAPGSQVAFCPAHAHDPAQLATASRPDPVLGRRYRVCGLDDDRRDLLHRCDRGAHGRPIQRAQRQDITVSFVEPRSAGAAFELERLPGVIYTESSRSVSARLRHGHRSRQTAITGLANGAELNRVFDISLEPITLPPTGLVLSTKLAEILDVRRGDELTLEVLEGTRPTRRVVVADLVEEYMGTAAYMEADALHKLMREGGNLSGAYIQVDSALQDELYRRLKAIPAVAGVALKTATVKSFQNQMDQTIGVMVGFATFFAGVIAFGVVYNAARVSLSERSRELASLRVMGFTRGEISYILLGELAAVTLVAIPLGLFLGYGLAGLICLAYDTEMYRFPLVVSARTYGSSALVVIVAAVVSGFIVRRRLDHLDLVEVLKTRE